MGFKAQNIIYSRVRVFANATGRSTGMDGIYLVAPKIGPSHTYRLPVPGTWYSVQTKYNIYIIVSNSTTSLSNDPNYYQ